MDGVQLRLGDANMETGEGEIQAKGENVMKGYYKAPELTSEVFTKDGWFKTGDKGWYDKDNFLYIKGRIKTMIVGASGENIYPEEIETIINKMRFVLESLVLEKKENWWLWYTLIWMRWNTILSSSKQIPINTCRIYPTIF